MKHILTPFFILFVLSLSLLSCDEIPPEIPDMQITGEKTVLVEDFTGVRCTNCPTAAQEISNLTAQYGENVIPVSLHAPMYSSFTIPHNGSKYDFRISKADEIAKLVELEIMGLPSAMFDRYDFDLGGIQGHVVNSVSDYAMAVSNRFRHDPELLISLTNDFNLDTRQLVTTAHIRALEDIEGDVYVTFMLLEDGIVDLQTDKKTIIEEYIHNNVLRDVYSRSPTGDKIHETLQKNDLIEVRRSVEIEPPEEGKEWNNPENMYSVVFVHRRGETLTCMQAAKAMILETE